MMNINNLSYEDSILELEKIIETLEKGTQPLEESVETFKRGVQLHKHCSKLLSKTEGEVKLLLEDDNIISEEDYRIEEGD